MVNNDYPQGIFKVMQEEIDELTNILDQLLKIKQAADNGTVLISNQGQALDGYSELANYRVIIEEYKELRDGQN